MCQRPGFVALSVPPAQRLHRLQGCISLKHSGPDCCLPLTLGENNKKFAFNFCFVFLTDQAASLCAAVAGCVPGLSLPLVGPCPEGLC